MYTNLHICPIPFIATTSYLSLEPMLAEQKQLTSSERFTIKKRMEESLEEPSKMLVGWKPMGFKVS
jgi:hypothetical protein